MCDIPEAVRDHFGIQVLSPWGGRRNQHWLVAAGERLALRARGLGSVRKRSMLVFCPIIRLIGQTRFHAQADRDLCC